MIIFILVIFFSSVQALDISRMTNAVALNSHEVLINLALVKEKGIKKIESLNPYKRDYLENDHLKV